ncbi:unnamed protein product [Protopolystoma xenopodis]|uniref:Serine/threonine-protein phosphatase PGAM5, mitochondrial n=1 Tax=Protopolystoma xenopodis TaxID=117903 RepID=A0A3S5AD70_9PLAT|nr:unnamed protein product [Protopolystoma xenopodis]
MGVMVITPESKEITSKYPPSFSGGIDLRISSPNTFTRNGTNPSKSRSSAVDAVALANGRRIEAAFSSHIHRDCITKSGKKALLGPENCKTCSALCSKDKLVNSDTKVHTCNCACHRIERGLPAETVVFVGHANVIRYFICRCLQLPPEAWLRFSLGHGSFTQINIWTSGRESPHHWRLQGPSGEIHCIVSVNRMGDVGHMDRPLISF